MDSFKEERKAVVRAHEKNAGVRWIDPAEELKAEVSNIDEVKRRSEDLEIEDASIDWGLVISASQIQARIEAMPVKKWKSELAKIKDEAIRIRVRSHLKIVFQLRK